MFEIPLDAPHGCYVPVLVRVNDVAVSNTVTMAIQSEGKRCVEPELPAITTFLDGGAIGVVDLLKTLFELDVDVLSRASFTVDHIAGYFHDETGGQFAFNPALALPSHDSCTAYAVAGDVLSGVPYPYVNSNGLDAGEITVNGPNGARALPRTVKGEETLYTQTRVGGPEGFSPTSDEPLFLVPGEHTVQGTGGGDVGPIQGATGVDPPVQWTNMDQLDIVERGDGLTFEWTAAGSPWVVVAGVSVDKPRNTSGIFICVAVDGVDSFRVPSEVLANLPASSPVVGQSVGFLALGVVPSGSPTSFSADGLNYGAVLSRTIHIKTVRFQ